MSINKNLFDLLGNDVEDDTIVSLPPKEVVKKSTSSKKSDVAPPSANPAKANKNRPRPTGNDAAIKTKVDNRSVDAPAPSSGSSKAKTDRKSKSGKTDSSKKVKKAWGDDDKQLETEVAAEIDAKLELEGEGEDLVEQAKNLKSVEQYFEELKLKQDSLSVKPIRKVTDDGSSEILIKKTENLVEPTVKKSTKSKAPKSKKYLEFEPVFSDQAPSSAPRSERSERSNAPRGGASRGRGSARGRGGNRGGAAASTRKTNKAAVVVDDTTFPSLS